MKPTILLICLFASTSLFSQATKQPQEPQEKSKIETFALKTGSLFKKEFTDLGTVKRVEVQKLTITDVLTNAAMTGVHLKTTIQKSYGSATASCFLDTDEIDGFLKSAKFLEALPAANDSYQEYQFTSRDGFQAGAYSDKKAGWKYFLKLERFDSDSYVFLDKDDFKKLSDMVSGLK